MVKLFAELKIYMPLHQDYQFLREGRSTFGFINPFFMTKNTTPILKHACIIGIVLLTLSCNITPEMEEPVPTPVADRSVGTFGGPVFPTFMTLDRVKIFTSGSNVVTGTVTVEIATSDGSVVGV